METEKRKRGRPPKNKNDLKIVNEQKKQITMTSNDIVTLDAVQQRWKTIFSKYGALGLDNISNAWETSFSQLNNPFLQNSRIKQINNVATKLSKQEMQEVMENPENNENRLCSVSMQLYYTNYIYYNWIQLNRNVPKYNWYVTPLYLDEKDGKSKTFKEESQKVDRIMKSLNPSLTFKTIATQVALQGKCSYLPRLSYDDKDVDFFVLQKLNSDMIKLTGFGSRQQFVASFNMAIFLQPAYDVSQYPQFIRDTWENMQNMGIITLDKHGKKKINVKKSIPKEHILEYDGTRYMYWVKLPQDLCWTFYSDGAHPMCFPDTIGLFSDLNDLGDYKWLQANLLSKGINSVLTAEVPLVKDPKVGGDSTAISPDTILGYQDFFASNISANIFPFFAPFEKFELHTLENQPESMDIIYNRTRDLIATSGNSALMSITDKPSIASVKASQAIQASKNDYLTRQFEAFLDQYINKFFDLKYHWKFNLWGDIFYQRDDVKTLKELVISGATGLIPKLLSSEGYSLEDYKGASIYVDSLDIKMKYEDLKNQNILMGSDSQKPVGRPKKEDVEIENDNTGISSDMGNNVSEIKDFSKKECFCLSCKNILKDNEAFLCDTCIKNMYINRFKK